MMDNPDQFTAVLSKFVYRSAYTPGQLASLTGIPKTTIVNWLNGRVARPRGYQRVVALAAALRLTEAEANQLLAAAQQPDLQACRTQATSENVQALFAFWETAVTPHPPFQAVALPSYFVGRETERESLVADLCQEQQTAVYCLHGMAGVGKTSLAAQIAYDLRHHFVDGVLWARLDSSDTMSILAAFAAAYQRDVSNCLDVASRSGIVRNLLSNRRVLIVLDNAQTSAQIEPLLPPTGQCALLVTTRRQDLTILIGAKRLEIRPFASNIPASLSLFAQILGQERVQAESELLSQMADELGHLPLALVLAASRLAYEPGWQTAQFRKQLRRVSQRLQALHYETQSVRRSFQLSYDWLDNVSQQLFTMAGRLGRQDFSAMALAALTSLDEAVVVDGLRQLCSLSLLQAGLNGRYTLHPLLHDFAQSLAEEDEQIAVRLVEYWATFVAAQRYTPTAVLQELGHIQVALQTALTQKMIRPLRHMLDDLMPTFLTRGEHSLAEHYLTQAQVIIEKAGDSAGQSWILLHLGRLERERHQLETAAHQLLTGLHLARQQQDNRLVAQFLTELGIVYNCLGKYRQGKLFLLEALPLARQTMAEDSLLNVLEELGILALIEDDHVAAAHYYQEGLALSQAQQHTAQSVMFLKSLGALYHLQGDSEQAKTVLAQGFTLAKQLQYRQGIMLLANNQGVVAFGAGEMASAQDLLQIAFKEAECLHDTNAIVLIGLNLAYWARQNGRFAQSHHYFSQVLAMAQAHNEPDLADKVQAELDTLVHKQEQLTMASQKRSIPPLHEHLKVFI